MKEIERNQALWERFKVLTDHEKSSLLAFVSGWCRHEKTFNDGVEEYLNAEAQYLNVNQKKPSEPDYQERV